MYTFLVKTVKQAVAFEFAVMLSKTVASQNMAIIRNFCFWFSLMVFLSGNFEIVAEKHGFHSKLWFSLEIKVGVRQFIKLI